MAEWENRLAQDSPLSRALRAAMPEDLRNPLLHPEAVNHFALPPQQPRAELRNLPPRPGDYLSPVSEALSPTMGAYGLGNALGDAYVKGREGDYKGMASPLAEILLSMAPVPGMKKGALPPNRIENPIRAYHGSPHDFDKFDLSKIGTGEGAQAYGHGLYFAENENVAQSYKGAGPLQQWSSLDPPRVDGHMYEVAIHATPDQFLDWDKPLSQQSEAVRRAFESAHEDWLRRNGSYVEGKPVGEWINMITGAGPRSGDMAREFSQGLAKKGLAGIEYLDQGSRGAGEGTKNRVVFDAALIEILRKYGLLGPVAAGATANALMGDKNEQ